MTRILFVIHFPVFGGPHNQALQLARPLSDRGFDTVVVVPDDAGDAAERLRAGGVAVRLIGLHRLRALRNLGANIALVLNAPNEIARLRAIIRSERISIVQIGGLVNPHAAIAARLERLPVVWQLLDTRAPWPVATIAMVFVRKLADVVMSTGLGVAKSHPSYAAIADRLIPFFPPVNLDRFAPDPERRMAARASWGVPADRLVVGCVANINPQKGIVELVRAFKLACVRSPGLKAALVLVGAEYPHHASYSASVRRQIKAEGLVEGQDVILVGGRADVEGQLAGMDIFALSAVPRSEGVTTSVLEAMAVGLPAVVTDVGALREAVDHGQTGFVIPTTDTTGFGLALADLLNDRELRSSMGQAARDAAEAMFGIDACVESHVQAYARAQAARGMRHQTRTPSQRRPSCRSTPGAVGKLPSSSARRYKR
jgi:glycosyltransferase involved in cell wall biosynthesis